MISEALVANAAVASEIKALPSDEDDRQQQEENQAALAQERAAIQAVKAKTRALKARQGEVVMETKCVEAANAQAAKDIARKEAELANRLGELEAAIGERSILDDKVKNMQMENGMPHHLSPPQFTENAETQ